MLAVPLAALLAACSSAPLPPWQADPGPRPVAVTPAVVIPPATGAPAPGAVAIPVPVPTGRASESVVGPGGTSAVPPPAAMAPESPAVAARFPEPAVRYDTPGLQVGRTTFTSNDELHAWLNQIATRAATSSGVQTGLFPIAYSQRGQPLEALVLTRSANTDASTLIADGRPTVLLTGQQHGDEPAGAEALLVVAREAASGTLASLLDRINLIVVPRTNPDGAALGRHSTISGVDLNRDHLLLRTPEAQGLARLVRDYRPMVVLDAHEFAATGPHLEKFGGVQSYDALLQYATVGNLPEFVTKAAEEWMRRPLQAALARERLTHEWYFTTSSDPNDRWVSMGSVLPDTGRNVNGLKNAVSLLVATRGAGSGRAHLQRRVHAQVTAITSVLQSTAQRADALRQLRGFVDREVSAFACRQDAVLDAGQTPARHTITLLDPRTGVDRRLEVDWNSALALNVTASRRRPCGYWLAADAAPAVERLKLLGVQVLRVSEPAAMTMDLYRETGRSAGAPAATAVAAAGAAPIRVQLALQRGLMDAPAGSYYVPLGQPMGSIAVAALEPDSPSGFFAHRVIDSLDAVARVTAPPPAALRFEDAPF